MLYFIHYSKCSDQNCAFFFYVFQSWDLALAKTARAWANKCTFEHSPYSQHPDKNLAPTGENLFISNGRKKIFDVVGAISAWHSEVKYYNYTTRTCKRVCGHYTQVTFIFR